ncbi:MAG: sigma-54 dependent transcriptional regulator [Planctomycetota bacterium]
MSKSPEVGPAVLLVDDDDALRNTLLEALESLDVDVEGAASVDEGKERIQEREFAVVVTDLVMGDRDGFEILAAAKERAPHCRIVFLTGHGSREVAVRAMQQGASYYIEKPIDLRELRTKVEKCLGEHARDVDYHALRERVAAEDEASILGKDPKMIRLLEVIRQIAPTQASVLITGESGTGKELVARAVHRMSDRCEKPFVALNCGGLAEGTIESELFGHVKGAFTGALHDREGKFEFADGGTLFLDEVGEMPLQTQVKFLRVLEERDVARLGSNKSRTVDVRVVAATNADLEQKVQDQEFRSDLYFRLKVVRLDLPPLRERSSDIKILVDHFLTSFAERYGKDVDSIDRDAMVGLVRYDWPGNVRELRNAVESMVVRARGNILTVQDLPPEIGVTQVTEHDGWDFLAGKSSDEVERNHIRVTLEMTDGNRVRAASLLGISERTLYRKIRDYDL